MNLTPLRHNLYILGLLLIAVGLPLSKAAMSIGQIVLAASWLIGFNYKNDFKSFFLNIACVAMISFFALHIFGLAYSTDMKYALDSIRIKLPLFVIPFLLFVSPPLSSKHVRLILKLFVASVFAGTIVSLSVLFGLTDKTITDIREISIFISHIRFSLMICLSIFLLFYELVTSTPERKKYIFLLIAICWFVGFLILIESVTGISILLLVGVFFLVVKIYTTRTGKTRFALLLGLLLVPCIIAAYLTYQMHLSRKNNILKRTTVEVYSAQGHKYDHRPNYTDYENGNPVYMYISREELMEEWKKRSDIPFDGKDARNQYVEYTLMRFLTSKGLRKDADGVRTLSDAEIHSIEKGIANVNYQNVSSLNQRIQQIIWEMKYFIRGGNPSGHSVAQRLEFWRVSLNIIKDHPVFGVGTGDVMKAFEKKYQTLNSPLSTDKRLKSHNQYLLAGVTFGGFGLVIFLLSLFLPAYRMADKSIFYYSFLLTMCISMITEDTLETQAGATYFAFFNSFFLFLWPKLVKNN